MTRPSIEKPLTPQQEKFCKAVVSGLSLSDAYRKAYKAGNMTARTINKRAGELMHNGAITGAVIRLREKVNEAFVIDTSALLRESHRVAHSDIRGIFHPDGRVKLPNELDDDTAHTIASFEIDEYGRVKYKLWDKSPASERLFKVKGLYAIDNKQKGQSAADFLNSLTGSVLGVAKITSDDDDT